MDSSSFNLETKINEFLETFNKTANSAIEDDLYNFNDGLIRSRSKFTMDDGLEMTGNASKFHNRRFILRLHRAPLFSIPFENSIHVLSYKAMTESSAQFSVD